MNSIIKKIDDVSFELKKDFDFRFLNKYGQVFKVFDKQDSGNICFGLKDGNKKLFIKYAGAPTINYGGKSEEAILRLQNTILIYEDIKDSNLINLIDHFEVNNGYALIFEWIDGECLHEHWNFDKYPKYVHPKSPNYKFSKLDLRYKLKCLDDIFKLHELIAKKGYVAIDFYDGSIIYDFLNNKTTICDIDFYTKGPIINTMGRMWGSDRFMSPEEFEFGESIDEITNVYTMGAIAFEVLGDNKTRDIESWKASENLYYIAKKAVNKNREKRYKSISEFYNAWKMENNKLKDYSENDI